MEVFYATPVRQYRVIALPVKGIHFCLHQRTFFLCIRTYVSFIRFFSSVILFLFSKKWTLITLYVLRCRGCFCRFVDADGLTTTTVLQCLKHIHRTNVVPYVLMHWTDVIEGYTQVRMIWRK
jgi:hypothetical protein